ncbi:MAG: histidine phosphatase family protein [Sandaracinaceae bacterium]
MYLTLIRHAESTWNATGQWQGQSDVPLSPRGRLQARSLATRMFGHEFDHAYVSDLSRAGETAEAIGLLTDGDARFREIDVGAWAGLTRKEVAERFAEELAALRHGKAVRIGGGESMEEFEARVDAAIDELRERHWGRRVLLVTHGGVIRALATRVLGVRNRPSPLVGVNNTSLSVMREVAGRLLLERYNDARHLEAADQDSVLARPPEPSTRMAVVAADPGGAADRALVDALLGGLGIAGYYAAPDALDTPLAVELLSDPQPAGGVPELHEEHPDSAFALLVRPEAIPGVVATALGLDPTGATSLAPPRHGTVTQIRLFEHRAELYCYGVHPLDD